MLTCCVDRSNSRIGRKWPKAKTVELRNRHDATPEVSPFQLIHSIVESLLNNVWLGSWLEKSIGADTLYANGTKRPVILARLDFLCFFVSASVEMSLSPKLATGNSIGPEVQQGCEST